MHTNAKTTTGDEDRVLNWDTREDHFSNCIALTTNIITPKIGLPNPSVVVQRIRDWCLPLEMNSETFDLIIIAQSIVKLIEGQ